VFSVNCAACISGHFYYHENLPVTRVILLKRKNAAVKTAPLPPKNNSGNNSDIVQSSSSVDKDVNVAAPCMRQERQPVLMTVITWHWQRAPSLDRLGCRTTRETCLASTIQITSSCRRRERWTGWHRRISTSQSPEIYRQNQVSFMTLSAWSFPLHCRPICSLLG